MKYLTYSKLTKKRETDEPIVYFKNLKEEPLLVTCSVSAINPIDCIVSVADDAVGTGRVDDRIVGDNDGVTTVIGILKTQGRQNLLRHAITDPYTITYEIQPNSGILILTQSTDLNTIVNTNFIWE